MRRKPVADVLDDPVPLPERGRREKTETRARSPYRHTGMFAPLLLRFFHTINVGVPFPPK
jgi:hypothetical protein